MHVEADIDKVTEDTDKEIVRYKEFCLLVSPRAVLIGAAPSRSDPQDYKLRSLKLRETCEKQVGRAGRDLGLERIKLPKFSGHKKRIP